MKGFVRKLWWCVKREVKFGIKQGSNFHREETTKLTFWALALWKLITERILVLRVRTLIATSQRWRVSSLYLKIMKVGFKGACAMRTAKTHFIESAYLISKTMISSRPARSTHASVNICLTSPRKQRRNMTKFVIQWRTPAHDAEMLLFSPNFWFVHVSLMLRH